MHVLSEIEFIFRSNDKNVISSPVNVPQADKK